MFFFLSLLIRILLILRPLLTVLLCWVIFKKAFSLTKTETRIFNCRLIYLLACCDITEIKLNQFFLIRFFCALGVS